MRQALCTAHAQLHTPLELPRKMGDPHATEDGGKVVQEVELVAVTPADDRTKEPDSDVSSTEGRTVTAEASPSATRCSHIVSFLFKWHLPIGLIIMVAFGLLVPAPGTWIGANTELSTACVVIIFFFSGVTLQTGEIFQALKDWTGIIAGVLLILGVTPLIGFLIHLIPLDSVAMLNGLALFFAMPTTISSGVVLTGQAKGSKAMALFFSVSTNILAVFTCPAYLSVLLRSDSASGGSIDVVSILWKLSLTVCLPLLVGKLLQMAPHVTETVSGWKPQIKLASSFFLVLIPWMKVSEAFPELAVLSGETVVAVIGIGTGAHLILLGLCGTVSLLLPISNANRKAIIISGSQKTIAIAAAFLALLPASMNPGVMVIPAIISHFAQIVVDAFVATWLVTALPTPDDENEAVAAVTKALSSAVGSAAMPSDGGREEIESERSAAALVGKP